MLPGARGAIVRDADWPVAVDDAAIERWRAHGEALAGGRGSAWRVRCEGQPAALRHYRRGGLLGGLLGDRYLWTGLERTRPYREFLLTARLHARGLPVPRPLAARIQRSGPYYRGDLLTGWLPDSRTLDLRLRAQSMRAADLARVGAAIAAFHDAGLDHADLNGLRDRLRPRPPRHPVAADRRTQHGPTAAFPGQARSPAGRRRCATVEPHAGSLAAGTEAQGALTAATRRVVLRR